LNLRWFNFLKNNFDIKKSEFGPDFFVDIFEILFFI